MSEVVNIYNLGDRLKYVRESLEIKQKDAALKLQINNKTLSNYENNVSSPDPNTIRLLCEFYQVSSDYLLGLSDHKEGNRNSYEEDSVNYIPLTREPSSNFHVVNENEQKIPLDLTEDDFKTIRYYKRLNEENKDLIKGTMVNLYKEQINSKDCNE